jgi:MFS family permease
VDPTGWRDSLTVLRQRQFRLQFSAHAISVVGSTLSPVALTVGVLTVMDSMVALGLVLAAYTVPLVLFVVVGGVWADRLPRQQVMVVADLVRAAAQCAVGALFLSGVPAIWQLVVLEAVIGVATAFYYPAATGLTAQTAPQHLLQPANALLALTRSIAGSLGPLCAGALAVTAGAGWALMVDGLTFLASAVLLARVRIPPRERTAAAPAFLVELRTGFHDVASRSWVWSSIGGFAVTNLLVGSLYVLGPTLLLKDGDAMRWAVLVAALSVGEAVGNVLALRVRPARPLYFARLVELSQALVVVAVAGRSPTWVLVIAAVASGAGFTLPDALWYTALQQHLPEASISRVSSYDWMGSLALRPLAYAGAAAVAGHVGITRTLMVGAILLVVSRLAAIAPAGVRQLRGDISSETASELGAVAVTVGHVGKHRKD